MGDSFDHNSAELEDASFLTGVEADRAVLVFPSTCDLSLPPEYGNQDCMIGEVGDISIIILQHAPIAQYKKKSI